MNTPETQEQPAPAVASSAWLDITSELKRNIKMKYGFTIVALMWVGGIILNIALIGAVIWVAWHFISKWW